jgi:hypothetical protein
LADAYCTGQVPMAAEGMAKKSQMQGFCCILFAAVEINTVSNKTEWSYIAQNDLIFTQEN